MKERIKIAALQFEFDDDPSENKKRIKSLIDDLDTTSLDIICLPELPIYGFNYEMIPKLSYEDIHRQKKFFSDLAKENKVNILAGLLEKASNEYYDTVIVFDRYGETVFKYRKTHLWSKEREFFSPGRSLDLCDIEGWKVGIGICADLGFPEFSRTLSVEGADILFFPSAWSEPYDDLWRLMNRAKAAENQLFVVSPNLVGSKDNFCGLSVAVNPDGVVIEELGKTKDYFVIEADKNKIKERREEIPWLSQRRSDIY